MSFDVAKVHKKAESAKLSANLFRKSRKRLCEGQCEPLDVAEVLAVRQQGVLRIHTDGALVLSGLLGRMYSLEGVVITLFLHHLQRLDREDMLLAVRVGIDVDLLNGNSIFKTLLVDDVAQGVLLPVRCWPLAGAVDSAETTLMASQRSATVSFHRAMSFASL